MAQNKSSNPTANKKLSTKGLPESVNWLLDFANLGSKPGKLNPGKILVLQKIKRPPVDPPPHGGMLGLLSRRSVLDKHGYSWIEMTDGSGRSFYGGKKEDYPSFKEFKNFFRKTCIKNDKRDAYGDLWDVWMMVHYSLNINNHYTYHFISKAESFVYDLYKYRQIPIPKPDDLRPGKLINGLEYPHDNTLTQVICAYILDFWHNHRELHTHLRQCKCCGKFWIEAKARKKFCCKKCEDRFNQASRQSVRDSLRKQRKDLDKKKEDIARNEIINWLCNAVDCTPEEAEEFYEYEKGKNSNNVKSLAQFKRTCGKNYKNLKN